MTKLEIKLAAALKSAMRNGWTPAEVDRCLTALNEFDLQHDEQSILLRIHHCSCDEGSGEHRHCTKCDAILKYDEDTQCEVHERPDPLDELFHNRWLEQQEAERK